MNLKTKLCRLWPAHLRCRQVNNHELSVGIDRVLMSTPEKGIESKEIHVEEIPNQTVK